jgi:hypothetical protein
MCADQNHAIRLPLESTDKIRLSFFPDRLLLGFAPAVQEQFAKTLVPFRIIRGSKLQSLFDYAFGTGIELDTLRRRACREENRENVPEHASYNAPSA